jgi:hypothetical protein
MNKVKPAVIYQRRKARSVYHMIFSKLSLLNHSSRQAKMTRSEYKPFASELTPALSPEQRQLDAIPLTSRASPYSANSSPTPYNASPYANPYSNDNNTSSKPATPLYAPQPRAPPVHLYEASTSSDDVGWDMRPMQHADPQAMYGHPRGPDSQETVGTMATTVVPVGRAVGGDPYEEYDTPYGGIHEDPSPYHPPKTASPEPQVPPQSLSQRQQQHPAALQPQRGPTASPLGMDMQTPTQAQYATWTEASPSPRQGESDLESDYVDVRLPSPPFNQTTTPVQSRPRGGTNSGSSPPPPSYRSAGYGR